MIEYYNELEGGLINIEMAMLQANMIDDKDGK